VGDLNSLNRILSHPHFVAGTIRDANKDYPQPCYALSYLFHRLDKKNGAGRSLALRNLLDLHDAIRPLETSLLVKMPCLKDASDLLKTDDARRAHYLKLYGKILPSTCVRSGQRAFGT
jgi:N-acyl-D-aspartate/D-glutamate deacylase